MNVGVELTDFAAGLLLNLEINMRELALLICLLIKHLKAKKAVNEILFVYATFRVKVTVQYAY